MPVLKKKKLLEKTIQAAVVKYAKSKGFRPFKRATIGAYGKTGDPDYEFNGPNRYTFFIEFKATGKTSTPKQLAAQQELRDLGFHVYECDDIVAGKAIVSLEIGAIGRLNEP